QFPAGVCEVAEGVSRQYFLRPPSVLHNFFFKYPKARLSCADMRVGVATQFVSGSDQSGQVLFGEKRAVVILRVHQPKRSIVGAAGAKPFQDSSPCEVGRAWKIVEGKGRN